MEVLFGPLVEKFAGELSPARILESMLILFVIWRKVKPHLTKIEERMAGLEKALREGFNTGNIRFLNLENRVKELEKKGDSNGSN